MINCLTYNDNLMDDLFNIGLTKCVGYIPVNVITGTCNMCVNDVREYCRDIGLDVIEFSEEESYISDGVIYCYDRKNLKKTLEENSEILKNAGIPFEDCDEYIKYIATNPVDKNIFETISSSCNKVLQV